MARCMTSQSRSIAPASRPMSNGSSAVWMMNASIRAQGPDKPTTPSSVWISRKTERMSYRPSPRLAEKSAPCSLNSG